MARGLCLPSPIEDTLIVSIGSVIVPISAFRDYQSAIGPDVARHMLRLVIRELTR